MRYGVYAAPERSNYEKTLATLSKSYKDGSEIAPDGLACIHGMDVSVALAELNLAVERGKAYVTEDGHYGPSKEFCAEIASKVAENERIDAENRKKYFSD